MPVKKTLVRDRAQDYHGVDKLEVGLNYIKGGIIWRWVGWLRGGMGVLRFRV